jgi:hypothetical protein
VLPSLVIEGRRQLNEVFARVMREGRADIAIPPLALFVLGGTADAGSTYVFFDDLRHRMGYLPIVGLYETASYFGQPTLHTSEKEVAYILKRYAKRRLWDTVFSSRLVYPGPAFLRMLQALREVMAILAREPLMVDTREDTNPNTRCAPMPIWKGKLRTL